MEPLLDRFNELTINNDSLAKYLIENEEHIHKLTVVTSSSVASRVFECRVKKIEDELANKRHKSFPQEAKEKGIDDLVNHFGQFRYRK